MLLRTVMICGIPTLTGVWKRLTPALLCGFEGFRTSVEGVPADAAETARELELEAEPEGGTESLHLIIKLTDEGLLLTDEQRKWLLETESAPGEGAGKC